MGTREVATHRVASGAEVVAEILRRARVETVFATGSEQGQLLSGALGRRGLRVVEAETSAGAVAMADAYSRVAGRLGVVLTPGGTAAADAAGALLEAHLVGSRLLHLVGEVPSALVAAGRDPDELAPDQLGMLRSVTRASWRASGGERLASVLVEAIAAADGAPGGAVAVELPVGVLAGPARPWRALPLPAWRAPSPAPSELEAAIALCAEARHPLVWSGGGPVRAGAFAEMRAFLETLGAGLLTSSSGRSIVPEDRQLVVGSFGSDRLVQDLLDSADLLVLVGCRLRSVERGGWRPELPRSVVQIDVDAGAIGRNCDPTLAIVADARQALVGLTGGVRALGREGPREPGWAEQVAKVTVQVREAAASALGTMGELPTLLREAFPAEAVVVEDVPRSRDRFDPRLLPILRPRGFVQAPSGSPGRGVAMAAGAALAAEGDEVLCVVTEHSLLAGAGELAVLSDEGLPARLVVLAGAGRWRAALEPAGVDDAGVARSPGPAEVASAFGIWSDRVRSLAALSESLDRARSVAGPSLVELDLDPTT